MWVAGPRGGPSPGVHGQPLLQPLGLLSRMDGHHSRGMSRCSPAPACVGTWLISQPLLQPVGRLFRKGWTPQPRSELVQPSPSVSGTTAQICQGHSTGLASKVAPARSLQPC